MKVALLNQRRALAVRLRLGGATVKAAADQSGLSRPTVIAAFKAHQRFGASAVPVKRTGKAKRAGTKLTSEQEYEIQRAVRTGTPGSSGLKGNLWSAALVGQLIELRSGVALSPRSLLRYLDRWSFAARPAPSDEEISETFPDLYACHVDYPEAVLQARKIGATLRWCEDTSLPTLRAAVHSQAGQRGVENDGSGQHTMIYVVTNRGDTRWLVFAGELSASMLIEFLMHLVNESEGRLYILFGDRPVHFDPQVKRWLEVRNDRICAVPIGAPRWMVHLYKDTHLD